MFVRIVPLTFALLWALQPSLGQTSKHISKQNQNVMVNKGIVKQYNYTVVVKQPIRERLKQTAKQDFGTERGWLQTITPANDDLKSAITCSASPDAISIIFGSNVITCDKDECPVLVDASPSAVVKDLLSARRRGKSMAIHAIVLDNDGKVLAAVESSKTHANTAVAFEWNRPDDHTIDVLDQHYRHVLHIRFSNPHTVEVEGLFRNSIGETLDARADKIMVGSENEISGNCIGSPKGPAFLF